MFVAIYFAFCVLVGLFAIGRRGGFFLYFLLSIVISPLVAMIVLLIATPVVVDVDGRVQKVARR